MKNYNHGTNDSNDRNHHNNHNDDDNDNNYDSDNGDQTMDFGESFVCKKAEFCESVQILMSSQCEPLPYL